MTIKLLPEERELVISMTGTSRDMVDIFSDDPYWTRRLDKIVHPYKVSGNSKWYLATIEVIINNLWRNKYGKESITKSTCSSEITGNHE